MSLVAGLHAVLMLMCSLDVSSPLRRLPEQRPALPGTAALVVGLGDLAGLFQPLALQCRRVAAASPP